MVTKSHKALQVKILIKKKGSERPKQGDDEDADASGENYNG